MTQQEELTQLRARLASSERLGDGYGDRVKALRKRIDELERAANTG